MQFAAAAIPILTGIVLWGALAARQRDWRSSFLSATIIWGAYLVGVTEILSWLRAISFRYVLAAWFLGLLLALALAALSLKGLRLYLMRPELPRLSAVEMILISCCALIAAVTALIAWIAPPNTHDSMTYHMARVLHWIQNASVAYYPTNMLRQLFLAPGAEYFILHLQILAGSDRLANFVEWFSMIGTSVGVSLIAREFGSNRQGQIYSVVAALTIPMGILQATSTQNNYITAFWLVCFVYWARLPSTKGNLWSTAAAAASLGLAALSKAITYVFALPFLIWWTLSLLRIHGVRSVPRFGLIGLVFLLINLGAYVRSQDLFGNPLGISQEVSIGHPEIDYKLSNDVFSIAALTSNVVRNVALHTSTPSDRVNSHIVNQIRAALEAVGISPDDHRTTWAGIQFGLPRLQFEEDSDGGFLHLIISGIGVLLILRRPARRKELVLYSLCVLSGFLIFCLYLKWQPFHTRLHLPLFILFSPVLGTLADTAKPRWIPGAISLLLVLAAMPWLFLNQSRPLVGAHNILNTSRNDLYFMAKPPVWRKSYSFAAQFLARESEGQCNQVGIYLDHNDYEYPIWVLLSQRIDKPISIESVDVHNISARTSSTFPPFTPCAIFVSSPLNRSSFQVNGRPYTRAWNSELVSVFLPR
ncbi:MAG: hypothetical protein V1755_10310 [Chloroflexota bacterium]